MTARIVKVPNVKDIRARVIKDRLPPGTSRIVCLSCGNASKALERVMGDIPVVSVDGSSPVGARRELSAQEIGRYFGPDSFNATSGYLAMDLVEEIGQRLMAHIPSSSRYFVPCGSGETIVAISFFIPLERLVAVTATYPPIESMGPLSRWLKRNMEVLHAGRVGSVEEALKVTARSPGVALCWED